MCWTFFWHGVEQSYDHHSRWLGTTTSKKNERTHTHTKRMQRDRKVSLLSVQLNLLYIMCVYVSCISNEIPFYLFIHFAICTHKRGSTLFSYSREEWEWEWEAEKKMENTIKLLASRGISIWFKRNVSS